MKKYINRIFSFLMVSLLVIGGMSVPAVNAISYKIPLHKDFNPNREANRIEAVVNEKSVTEIIATDNKVSIDGTAALQKHNEAVEKINEYITKLNNNGMYLNRDIVNTVTVNIKDINLSTFAEILIDESNLDKIKDITIFKIALSKNEYISLSKESIALIAQNHKSFKIQIKKLSDTYNIRFLDWSNSIIDKYSVDIKVGIPAKHSEQTVYAFINNAGENWGGAV